MPQPQNETETFQHYQVLKRPDGSLWELGRGAMGITYKAFDTNLRSHVALKVVNAMYLHSETAKARFVREARAAAALRHRNVASVYHLGNDDQSFFYAMEFVDGETVAGMVEREGPLPVTRALQIVLQVARALGAAHKQKLVHRDIKPANLMVFHEDDDDHLLVKVIDFGLARSAVDQANSSSGPITMGGFVGTAQFASPEQLQEQELDTRSDIYSLGITLWYMLTGRPPFTGPMFSLFSQHLTKEPPWEQLPAHVTPSVRAVLARMLQKSPADRFQTPGELRRALDACLQALAGADTSSPGSGGGLSTSGAVTQTGDLEDDTDSLQTGTLAQDGQDFSPTAFTPATLAAGEVAGPIEVGAVLAKRYQLVKLIGEGSTGQLYQARDLSTNSNKPVALRVLRPGLAATPAEMTQLRDLFARLRTAPHPNLLNVFALGRHGMASFAVMEWASGPTLVDVLRCRGCLELEETLLLLSQAVSATDHARANGLENLELGARQILLHFFDDPPPGNAGVPAALSVRLRSPMEQWPEFLLKLNAFGFGEAQIAEAEISSDMTMVPVAPRHPSRDTQSSIQGLRTGGGYTQALAELVYELLSGAPPDSRAAGREMTYVSLAALNEAGNVVLRRAMLPSGKQDFATDQDFFEALARASGLDPAVWMAKGLKEPPPEAELSEAGFDSEISETLVDAPMRAKPEPTSSGGRTLPPPTRAPVPLAPPTAAAAAAALAAPTLAPSHAATAAGGASVFPTAPAPRNVLAVWMILAQVLVLVVLVSAGLGWWFFGRGKYRGDTADKDSTPGLSPPSPSAGPSPAQPSGPQTLRVPEQYATLQAAVEAARSGDTVQLAPGSYKGPVFFKDGIRLAGTDPEKCLITPGEAAGAVIIVTGCNAGVIENVGVQGNHVPQDGILLTRSTVQVIHCVVSGMGRTGIVVHDLGSRPSIKNNVCRGNDENGMAFERGAGGVAEDNVIEENKRYGIIIGDRGSAPELRRNRSARNVQHGLVFIRGSAGVAEKNTLVENGGGGIVVDGSDSVPTLRENTCRDNRGHGIGYIRGSGGLAEKNIIEANDGSGILIDGSDTAPTLRGNRCAENGKHGLDYEKAGGGLAEDNILEGNQECGIVIADALTLPTLRNNTCIKNKQFGIATIGAPKFKIDPSNKLIDNILGPVTRQ